MLNKHSIKIFDLTSKFIISCYLRQIQILQLLYMPKFIMRSSFQKYINPLANSEQQTQTTQSLHHPLKIINQLAIIDTSFQPVNPYMLQPRVLSYQENHCSSISAKQLDYNPEVFINYSLSSNMKKMSTIPSDLRSITQFRQSQQNQYCFTCDQNAGNIQHQCHHLLLPSINDRLLSISTHNGPQFMKYSILASQSSLINDCQTIQTILKLLRGHEPSGKSSSYLRSRLLNLCSKKLSILLCQQDDNQMIDQ